MAKNIIILSIIFGFTFNLCTYSQGYVNCDVKRNALRVSYQSQVGIQEATGNNDGEPEKYCLAAGLAGRWPWCACFVYWNFLQIGDTLKIEYPYRASSWYQKDRIVWTRTGTNNKPVVYTDVLTLYYSSLGRIGHTGFIDGEEENNWLTTEGNTNSQNSREGNGAFNRRRLKNTVHAICRFLNCSSQPKKYRYGHSHMFYRGPYQHHDIF